MNSLYSILIVLICLGFIPSAQAQENPVVPKGVLGEFRHGTFPCPPLGDLTHPGVDIVAPCGSPIYAFADGKVLDVIKTTSDKNFTTLGYMAILEHPASLAGRTFFTLYLHLQKPPDVEIGSSVKGGKTKIGQVGVTGKALGCHTHFEIRYFSQRLSAWGNIYGKGDQRNSEYFKSNWEDPIVYFEKYPKGLTLAQNSEDLQHSQKYALQLADTFEIVRMAVGYQISWEVTRGGKIGDKVSWVIEEDGGIVLERNANSETKYTYFRNVPGHKYRVWLKEFIDGRFQTVSNVVSYEIPNMLYQVNLGPDYEVTRSGNLEDAVTWVIEENGKIVLERNAGNEIKYTYYRHKSGNAYKIWIKAFFGGMYWKVSNVITYRYP